MTGPDYDHPKACDGCGEPLEMDEALCTYSLYSFCSMACLLMPERLERMNLDALAEACDAYSEMHERFGATGFDKRQLEILADLRAEMARLIVELVPK